MPPAPARFSVVLAAVLSLAPRLAAQSDSLLRPVTPVATGVELTGPSRPGAYVSAVGRRAIAMGTERGDFEVWTWPLKLLHGFRLRFQTPLFNEPIDAASLAREVEITPAGPVITYTHPAFTVRQRVFAPVDEPAVVMLLDVDAVRPVEILAEFISDLQLAWPGAIGGQYVFWDDSAKAFVLSESQRRVNGLVGSPFTASATNQPAHNVPDAPSQLRIVVGDTARVAMPRPGEPAGRLTPLHVRGIPIVLVGGALPRDSVRAIYRRVLAEIPRLYRERVAHADSVLQRSMWIHSPDPGFDRAVRWASLNLDEALVCNPDLGCGLVAGYGPSESRGARPGFAWFFGGDASINSLGLDAAGQFETARRALEFFVRYQRSDGKIPHEISQSAGRIRWFEDYPYAFYHADTTPYWLMAWGDYWKATADTATIRRVWPAIRKAYEWCRTTVDSTTGLMLNSKGGLGAVEVGDLGVGVRSDIYLSAVWVEALDRMARMADAVERRPARRKSTTLGAEARALRERALASVRERFWLPAQGFYAFALLEDGTIRPELTVWPSTAMSFGLFDDQRGMLGARTQARATLLTDWGARSLAGESSLFDPLHYNNGTVWPFVTGFTALGQYRYRNPVMGFTALQQIARSGFTWGLGRNPEVFAGMQYEPLETAVPQQFFGTSFIPTVLARGLVGWEPDLPAGVIRFAPQIPAGWDSLTVHNAPAGRAAYELAIGNTPGRLSVSLSGPAVDSGSGPAPVIRFEPHLPPGSVVTGVTADGAPASCDPPTQTPRDMQPSCTVPLRIPLRIEVRYLPGFEVMLPEVRPERGDRSRGLRLVDQRLRGDSLVVDLEGPAGSTASLRVRHGTERTIPVTFPPGGDRIDGYSAAEIVVGP